MKDGFVKHVGQQKLDQDSGDKTRVERTYSKQFIKKDVGN
jgi:hypothetical protein